MVKNPLWGVLLLASSSVLAGVICLQISEMSFEDPTTIIVIANAAISFIAGVRMLTSQKGE